MSSKDRNGFTNFKYFDKVKPSYIFTKINYQTDEKPHKMVSKNNFSKISSPRSLSTVNSLPLDNLAHFLGHTAIMNPFKYTNM